MTQAREPKVDFDQHSTRYAEAGREQLDDMRQLAPACWTDSHGGYWVLTRHADVMAAERDWETYSCDNDLEGVRGGGRGVSTPPGKIHYPLSESDPPVSTALRQLVAPFFRAEAVAAWAPVIQGHIDTCIDAVLERGEVDFCRDLAIPVPAKTTLQLIGVGADRWEDFALSAHAMSYEPSTSPRFPYREIARLQQLIRDLLVARRSTPANDVISALANGEALGAKLTDDVATGILTLMVLGGFDTTTSLILNALEWLERRPDTHERLRRDDVALGHALEEFLRAFPSIQGVARTLAKPAILNGQMLPAGDRVFLSYAGANTDPQKFECPAEIRLERPNAASHLTFGAGGHRCLGAPLARLEARLTVRAVLDRLPDFRIDRARARRYPTVGRVNGWLSMPARFTPSASI